MPARALEQTGSIVKFTLGQPRRLAQVSDSASGFTAASPSVAALLALFERVAAGDTEFCMVSGHSGVGKSALVNEISRSFVQHDGYLIQGKFDQFQRSKPYSAVASAFRSLIPQLLAESRSLAARPAATTLAAAVSPNLGLLIDLVPELELIIGPQPPVSAAAANRGAEPLSDHASQLRQGHRDRQDRW